MSQHTSIFLFLIITSPPLLNENNKWKRGRVAGCLFYGRHKLHIVITFAFISFLAKAFLFYCFCCFSSNVCTTAKALFTSLAFQKRTEQTKTIKKRRQCILLVVGVLHFHKMKIKVSHTLFGPMLWVRLAFYLSFSLFALYDKVVDLCSMYHCVPIYLLRIRINRALQRRAYSQCIRCDI